MKHKIKLTNWEKHFLDIIDLESHGDVSIGRNEFNILYVTKPCPCKEIESLTAYIKENEVVLSCEITHSHFDSNSWNGVSRGMSQDQIMEHAAKEFHDFIRGKIVVSQEFDSNDRIISSGWRSSETPKTDNKEYRELIKKMHGETYVKEWNWFGEINLEN